MTIAVTVYASTNESRFISVQTQVDRVFAALNHLSRPLFSGSDALHFPVNFIVLKGFPDFNSFL